MPLHKRLKNQRHKRHLQNRLLKIRHLLKQLSFPRPLAPHLHLAHQHQIQHHTHHPLQNTQPHHQHQQLHSLHHLHIQRLPDSEPRVVEFKGGGLGGEGGRDEESGEGFGDEDEVLDGEAGYECEFEEGVEGVGDEGEDFLELAGLGEDEQGWVEGEEGVCGSHDWEDYGGCLNCWVGDRDFRNVVLGNLLKSVLRTSTSTPFLFWTLLNAFLRPSHSQISTHVHTNRHTSLTLIPLINLPLRAPIPIHKVLVITFFLRSDDPIPYYWSARLRILGAIKPWLKLTGGVTTIGWECVGVITLFSRLCHPVSANTLKCAGAGETRTKVVRLDLTCWGTAVRVRSVPVITLFSCILRSISA